MSGRRTFVPNRGAWYKHPTRRRANVIEQFRAPLGSAPSPVAAAALRTMETLPDHNYFSNLIWQIADLLRGPYRPPQYERVMLPMTVLRRFDCVLALYQVQGPGPSTKGASGRQALEGDALDTNLNKAAGQRFHNHSPLDFEKLKSDPDNIEKHLVSYIKGFSKNARDNADHRR